MPPPSQQQGQLQPTQYPPPLHNLAQQPMATQQHPPSQPVATHQYPPQHPPTYIPIGQPQAHQPEQHYNPQPQQQDTSLNALSGHLKHYLHNTAKPVGPTTAGFATTVTDPPPRASAPPPRLPQHYPPAHTTRARGALHRQPKSVLAERAARTECCWTSDGPTKKYIGCKEPMLIMAT